jgi:hypothetical protein
MSAQESELEQLRDVSSMHEYAFYGEAGAYVRAIESCTEADPNAILMQLLVMAGNVVGRKLEHEADGVPHHTNLFLVLVGVTSNARKGTSYHRARRPFQFLDNWGRTVGGGLTSGEGLISLIRDPVEKEEPVKEKGVTTGYQKVIVDAGVPDKRLMIKQSEFSAVLKVASRDGNTLTDLVREAFDGGDLHLSTRNNPLRATAPHISLIGHITNHELCRLLTETDQANGFCNRILFCYAYRSRLLPFSPKPDPSAEQRMASCLRAAIQFAEKPQQLTFSKDATQAWELVYPVLSQDRLGLTGAMCARAEALTLRLSMIYAILDCSSAIELPHLLAGLAVWSYSERTVNSIFADRLGDDVADAIMDALRQNPDGLTRTEISAALGRHVRAERIAVALNVLARMKRATPTSEKTKGAPLKRWQETAADVAVADAADQYLDLFKGSKWQAKLKQATKRLGAIRKLKPKKF